MAAPPPPLPPGAVAFASDAGLAPRAAELRDRARGCLLGLAVADSLGSAVEFTRFGAHLPVAEDTFERFAEYPNPHRLSPGQWTDDTSMALCLATSLVGTPRVCDPGDQLRQYRRWAHEGYLSSNGVCFDIGVQTSAALSRRDWATAPLLPLLVRDDIVGANGAIMRLGPLAVALLGEADFGVRATATAAACRTTHSTPACIQACILLAELLRALLLGAPKAAVLTPAFLGGVFTAPDHAAAVAAVEGALPVHPTLAGLLACGWRGKVAGGRHGDRSAVVAASSEVVATLEAALWAWDATDSFVAGAVKAVNLGDDADTVGAVFGQIAGAADGASRLPGRWTQHVARASEITALADGLVEVAVG
jgi:ADP-ribosyl-[dinitrogen reductase] hydrolase